MVGSDAAPAGVVRNHALGRPRDPPGRHYDRSAGSRLDWDWPKAANSLQGARPRKRGSGPVLQRELRREPRWSAGRRESLRQRLAAVTGGYRRRCAARRSVPFGKGRTLAGGRKKSYDAPASQRTGAASRILKQVGRRPAQSPHCMMRFTRLDSAQ